jgi:hypothetical protein
MNCGCNAKMWTRHDVIKGRGAMFLHPYPSHFQHYYPLSPKWHHTYWSHHLLRALRVGQAPLPWTSRELVGVERMMAWKNIGIPLRHLPVQEGRVGAEHVMIQKHQAWCNVYHGEWACPWTCTLPCFKCGSLPAHTPICKHTANTHFPEHPSDIQFWVNFLGTFVSANTHFPGCTDIPLQINSDGECASTCKHIACDGNMIFLFLHKLVYFSCVTYLDK